MDDEVKSILSDIYHVINERLETSGRIDEQVRRLEELGFKFSIYLEATILLNRIEPESGPPPRPSTARRGKRSGGLKLDDRDLRFLSSLKITVDGKSSRS